MTFPAFREQISVDNGTQFTKILITHSITLGFKFSYLGLFFLIFLSPAAK